MARFLLIICKGVENTERPEFDVNSVYKRKRDGVITKSNWYKVFWDRHDLWHCTCPYIQYHDPKQKYCSHVREIIEFVFSFQMGFGK